MILQVSPVLTFRGRAHDGSHPYPLVDMSYAEPQLSKYNARLVFAEWHVLSSELFILRKTV